MRTPEGPDGSSVSEIGMVRETTVLLLEPPRCRRCRVNRSLDENDLLLEAGDQTIR